MGAPSAHGRAAAGRPTGSEDRHVTELGSKPEQMHGPESKSIKNQIKINVQKHFYRKFYRSHGLDLFQIAS